MIPLPPCSDEAGSSFFDVVAPLIGISPSVANIIEGQQLTLPCTLLAGNPIPERRWMKNSAMVRTFLIPAFLFIFS